MVLYYTRFLPFLIFSSKEQQPPEVVRYLGRVLPAAIFGMLIVYGLKGVTPFLLHVNLDSEDYDSLGGYIIELLDHLPSEGEIAEDEHFIFKVVSVDKNRMETIHIIPKENSNHISQN